MLLTANDYFNQGNTATMTCDINEHIRVMQLAVADAVAEQVKICALHFGITDNALLTSCPHVELIGFPVEDN